MGVRVGPFERTSDAIQATLGTHGRGGYPDLYSLPTLDRVGPHFCSQPN